jgi:hypothetical protein
MLNLPPIVINLLKPFAPCFQGATTWMKAQVLLTGTILTPGKRVVSEALRVMGLSESRQFAQYHQVLNRAVWSPLALAQVLLRLLVAAFIPADQALVFGIDPTIERRWGRKIAARGIYRDAVRSSDSHFVKTSGLRWVSLMLLATIPWAQRVWALPVITGLSPSERYYEQRRRVPKTLLERSLQILKVLRRWWPQSELVVVGDNTYAALDFLNAAQQLDVAVIVRLRLDAALYEPAPPYSGKGRPRKKGQRLPTLATSLSNPALHWQRVDLSWYDGQRRAMDIASHTAVWYHNGKPPVPMRWVLIRDPQKQYAAVALLCTDPQQTARILSPGSCSAGSWKSPLKKLVAIWAWKANANGRRKPLPAQRRCCWEFSPGLPCWLMPFTRLNRHAPHVGLRGTANPCQRSPMPWLSCGNTCGRLIRLSEHPAMNPICLKSPNPYSIHLSRPCAMLHECAKSS